MLKSMTGYAAATGRRDKTAVIITVKSVNHRFFDLHLRLAPELEPIEAKIRRAIRDHVTRGHVDVNFVLEREGGVEAHVDRGLVSAYLDAFYRLRSDFGLTAEPDLNAVFKLQGALNFMPAALAAGEAEEMEKLVLDTLDDALVRLDAMRGDEARAIAADLKARLDAIISAAGEIEALRDGASHYYMERLRERLRELLEQALSDDRLAQETALLADRSDVSEELVRLRSHARQFQEMLDAPGDSSEVGKRLDFLLQEMNREGNTILSKTSGLGEAGIRITRLGLQVKADIEKLREQVQNLQ